MTLKSIFYYFPLFISLLFISLGCEYETKASKGGEVTIQKEAVNPKNKVMKLNIDMDHQEKAQMSTDQGFQPWRNNPIDVAEESIISLGIGSSEGKSVVLSENQSDAEVRVESNSGTYKVSLKKIVRPDGIWTSTRIEQEAKKERK